MKKVEIISGVVRFSKLALVLGLLMVASCTDPEEEVVVKVTIEAIPDVGYQYCVIEGNIVDLGGSELDQHGFCYGLTENPTVSDQLSGLGKRSTTGIYRDSITGLSPGTKYYIKAYAEASGITFYADQRSFTTKTLAVPTLITKPAESITATSARTGGDITDNGGSPVTARGVCWDTSNNPSLSGSYSEDGTGTGSFTSQLSGLLCNTTYYIRAYATNTTGSAYGQVQSFTTGDCTTDIPVVTTSDASNVTSNSALCGGVVTDEGGAAITARGVCYGTSQNPTVYGTHTTEPGGTGTFTSQLSGLDCATAYYIRAYATNSLGTSYGDQKSFTTAACGAGLPEVTTASLSSITETSALGGGNVTGEGGSPVTTRGVCWSVSSGPTTGDNLTVDGSGTGTFASQLSGLNCGATYYVRAYATNSAGTAYGSELQFTTSACSGGMPVVTTSAISGITESGAQGGGNVTDEGGSPVTVRGVCWNTSTNPTFADGHTVDGSGTGIFESAITGLACNTTYYVRAYAANTSGTAYGDQVTFTTGNCPSGIPVVSTFVINNITGSSAQGGGNVSDDGGSTVTARGVCWSTSNNPDLSGDHTVDGSGTGVFTSQMTGLNCNTTYYVRAYAVNPAGTAYGQEVTFTTGTCLPTLTTAEVTGITGTTATAGGDISSDGGSAVTARGVCWSTSPEATTNDNLTNDGTGTGSYTSELTGLECNTTYYMRAYATNDAGTAYGQERQFTSAECPVDFPTVTTASISNITMNSATGGGEVTGDGGGTVSARGICWSTSPGPTFNDSHTDEGGGTGAFPSDLTGLSCGTTYYVKHTLPTKPGQRTVRR